MQNYAVGDKVQFNRSWEDRRVGIIGRIINCIYPAGSILYEIADEFDDFSDGERTSAVRHASELEKVNE